LLFAQSSIENAIGADEMLAPGRGLHVGELNLVELAHRLENCVQAVRVGDRVPGVLELAHARRIDRRLFHDQARRRRGPRDREAPQELAAGGRIGCAGSFEIPRARGRAFAGAAVRESRARREVERPNEFRQCSDSVGGS
jgi:hypothetical protein